MPVSCGLLNAIFTSEYDFTPTHDFGFLKANRKPAVCSRCENEMGAKTENRQIYPIEGSGNRNPQQGGRRIRKLILEFLNSVAVSCFRSDTEKIFEKSECKCL